MFTELRILRLSQQSKIIWLLNYPSQIKRRKTQLEMKHNDSGFHFSSGCFEAAGYNYLARAMKARSTLDDSTYSIYCPSSSVRYHCTTVFSEPRVDCWRVNENDGEVVGILTLNTIIDNITIDLNSVGLYPD